MTTCEPQVDQVAEAPGPPQDDGQCEKEHELQHQGEASACQPAQVAIDVQETGSRSSKTKASTAVAATAATNARAAKPTAHGSVPRYDAAHLRHGAALPAATCPTSSCGSPRARRTCSTNARQGPKKQRPRSLPRCSMSPMLSAK